MEGQIKRQENIKSDIAELLSQGQSVQFMPKGYSMYPFLNPDKQDQVIIQPLGERSIRRGDVVLYRRDGAYGETDEKGFAKGILVLHRIIRREGDEIYLVGDNQNQVEGPLRTGQVLGIMVARIRKGKTMNVTFVPYKISAALWMMVCPIRPKIMRMAEILKNFIIGKKKKH